MCLANVQWLGSIFCHCPRYRADMLTYLCGAAVKSGRRCGAGLSGMSIVISRASLPKPERPRHRPFGSNGSHFFLYANALGGTNVGYMHGVGQVILQTHTATIPFFQAPRYLDNGNCSVATDRTASITTCMPCFFALPSTWAFSASRPNAGFVQDHSTPQIKEETKRVVIYETSMASVPLATAKDTSPASPIRRFSDSETNLTLRLGS